jgi:hypothetical protein
VLDAGGDHSLSGVRGGGPFSFVGVRGCRRRPWWWSKWWWLAHSKWWRWLAYAVCEVGGDVATVGGGGGRCWC